LIADDTNLRFQQTVLPHLDTAFNLARWMTGSDHDAQDVTQEACLRALKYLGTQGASPRAWLLAIVRNTCRTWLEKNRPREVVGTLLADELMDIGSTALNPEVLAIRRADREVVRQAIEQLPLEYREIVVLREIEGLSYKEIGQIADLPLGTVMSRLSRARGQLEQSMAKALGEGPRDTSGERGAAGGM
jgi:RNA polymerase sigma factor (sigma-70 family)